MMVHTILATIVSFLLQAPSAGPIVGVGNFSHIASNLDRSLEFYRDVLGLEVNGQVRPFDPNPAIMKLGNTIGAQSRMVQLKVPNSALGVEIIEYKDIDRKPANPRFQDPGAANLILRVPDLDAVMARARKAGVRVLSAGGSPVTIGNGATKVVFLQDPDGFIVELNQSANGTGAAFEVAVEDTAKTVEFYRNAFGVQPNVGASFNGDKLLTDTAGTPGAQFRQSRFQIPGTAVSMTFIEFKDIERKPLRTRVQDPGTAILHVLVKDMGTALKNLKAAGGTVVSTGGEAVSIGTARIALVRDPNNLILELIQR
jgi:catechol 2,3-dioxygenase-like lactoylglutathione lyase family enzyme